MLTPEYEMLTRVAITVMGLVFGHTDSEEEMPDQAWVKVGSHGTIVAIRPHEDDHRYGVRYDDDPLRHDRTWWHFDDEIEPVRQGVR